MDTLRNILKLCLTNLMASYKEITPLIEERKAKDIMSLDFCEVFNTVFHKILTERCMKYGLDAQTVR